MSLVTFLQGKGVENVTEFSCQLFGNTNTLKCPHLYYKFAHDKWNENVELC